MDQSQKQILLKVARDAVEAVVNNRPVGSADSDDPELNAQQGCFVTLKNKGDLRGCIGRFTADKPLIKLITEMAVSSAAHDPRFLADPIGPGELKDLDIEISVLSLMKETDDPLNLRLGIDGIYITDGRTSGCFLPQVATETGWDAREFLSYCCAHKAGLAADAWETGKAKVYLFSADVFGEPFERI